MKETHSKFEDLCQIVEQLRADRGCPWDKKQTTQSLVKYLREEFQEIIDAIDRHDLDNLCEELGDFLFLIVMMAHINSQDGYFSLADVLDSINEKLVRRHPHVFSDTPIADEETLRKQWQEIKKLEKAEKK